MYIEIFKAILAVYNGNAFISIFKTSAESVRLLITRDTILTRRDVNRPQGLPCKLCYVRHTKKFISRKSFFSSQNGRSEAEHSVNRPQGLPCKLCYVRHTKKFISRKSFFSSQNGRSEAEHSVNRPQGLPVFSALFQLIFTKATQT